MIWWLTLACLPNPDAVSLSGQVLVSQYEESGAPDVQVQSINAELAPFAEAVTGADGEFEVEVEAGLDLDLELPVRASHSFSEGGKLSIDALHLNIWCTRLFVL